MEKIRYGKSCDRTTTAMNMEIVIRFPENWPGRTRYSSGSFSVARCRRSVTVEDFGGIRTCTRLIPRCSPRSSPVEFRGRTFRQKNASTQYSQLYALKSDIQPADQAVCRCIERLSGFRGGSGFRQTNKDYHVLMSSNRQVNPGSHWISSQVQV